MHVSEDGKSLVPDDFDKCRWQAMDLVKAWLEAHPGKLIVGDSERDALVHKIGFAIWGAKGKPNRLLVPSPPPVSLSA